MKTILRVKMGAGNCLFFAGKMGFYALGLGFNGQKIENGNGNKVCAKQPVEL